MSDSFRDPSVVAPASALVGAVVTALLNFLAGRRKSKDETATAVAKTEAELEAARIAKEAGFKDLVTDVTSAVIKHYADALSATRAEIEAMRRTVIEQTETIRKQTATIDELTETNERQAAQMEQYGAMIENMQQHIDALTGAMEHAGVPIPQAYRKKPGRGAAPSSTSP